MGIALDLLDEVLRRFPTGQLVGIGHSAGANALLQYQARGNRPFDRWILVQPVFDFAESAQYMYANGYAPDLWRAIGRWVQDEDRLVRLLSTKDWLDAAFWFRRGLREEIDSFSRGIRLGQFLEDFYIRNNDTSKQFSISSENITVFLSPRDRWYDVNRTRGLCAENRVLLHDVVGATDHFLTGSWGAIWRAIVTQPGLRTDR